MSILSNPTQKDPERAFALQKYLLLHSQHDVLQKHLESIITSVSPTATHSPDLSPDLTPDLSPDLSPDRSYHRHSSLSTSSSSGAYRSSSPPTRDHQRSSSIPHSRPPMFKRRSSLPTVLDEDVIGEILTGETELNNVNQQIKSTLTELLNCDSVRGDRRYRMWVQTRLMDAEKELRGSRSRSCERRRGSEDFDLGV